MSKYPRRNLIVLVYLLLSIPFFVVFTFHPVNFYWMRDTPQYAGTAHHAMPVSALGMVLVMLGLGFLLLFVWEDPP